MTFFNELLFQTEMENFHTGYVYISEKKPPSQVLKILANSYLAYLEYRWVHIKGHM